MSDDFLSKITVIAGDDNGGPHLKIEIDSHTAADELTDEAVASFRKAAIDTFHKAFSNTPEQVVVMVEDAA